MFLFSVLGGPMVQSVWGGAHSPKHQLRSALAPPPESAEKRRLSQGSPTTTIDLEQAVGGN